MPVSRSVYLQWRSLPADPDSSDRIHPTECAGLRFTAVGDEKRSATGRPPGHTGLVDGSETHAWVDDLDRAVDTAVAVLGQVGETDWHGQAGDLDWTRHQTVEHVADDLLGYSTQLTGRATSGYAPFEVNLDEDTDTEGRAHVIRACGGLLGSAVRTAPTHLKVWHPFGMADPPAVAAMGIVEVVVHTHDIVQGLSLDWRPPEGLSHRCLKRLFPDVELTDDEWPTLLWATGRTILPDRERRREWRWHNEQATN